MQIYGGLYTWPGAPNTFSNLSRVTATLYFNELIIAIADSTAPLRANRVTDEMSFWNSVNLTAVL